MFACLQISARGLLALDRFKERLEVSFAKTLRAFALNDFEEQRRPILDRFGKNLEQITFVVAVDQNPEFLQRAELFVDVTDAIEQRVVVIGRNIQELETTFL